MSHPITDAMLIDHVAVLAKTGRGKSYLAKGVIERLLKRKERVCIVDPKDAYWGLKSSADGKSPAFEITVFGGPHADIPLLGHHGKMLAEAIATGDISCIICTKGMPEAERIRFCTDFFQTLDQRNTQPIHLIIDEAHMMAPQKPLGEMQRLTHWTAELVSGGRGMGFRIMLLSQRPARLNKDVLTQCETLIAMGMTGPQDRDAVKSWIVDQADIDKGKEIIASLPGLPKGEGWIWAPTLGVLKRVTFPKITTYDNSRTEKDGKADLRAKLAPVDIGALEAKLGSAQAEIDAVDPKKLKAKIVELEKRLGKIVDRVVTPPKMEAPSKESKKADFDRGVLAGQKQLARQVGALRGMIAKLADHTHTHLSRIGDELKAMAAEPPPITDPAKPIPLIGKLKVTAPKPQPVSAEVTGDLDGPQRRILTALAEWAAMGFPTPTREQVAILANYHIRTGSFLNAMGALRSQGLIDYDKGTLFLTEAGNALASAEPMTADEIHARIRTVLDGPQTKIFDFLIAHVMEVTREELAAATNYHIRTGSFLNALGRLRTLTVIAYGKHGTVYLRPWVHGVEE